MRAPLRVAVNLFPGAVVYSQTVLLRGKTRFGYKPWHPERIVRRCIPIIVRC
jgi:hypothetical protein